MVSKRCLTYGEDPEVGRAMYIQDTENGSCFWDVQIGVQVRGKCDRPGNKQGPEKSELSDHILPSEIHPI